MLNTEKSGVLWTLNTTPAMAANKEYINLGTDQFRGGRRKMQMQAVRVFILFLVLVCCNLAYAQSIMVGPDRKFEKGVISVPYGFYNKNFGAAIGTAAGEVFCAIAGKTGLGLAVGAAAGTAGGYSTVITRKPNKRLKIKPTGKVSRPVRKNQ